MLSPASTAVNVTQDSDYVFRNIFTDDFQGRSLAVYAGKVLGLKKVAVLFDNDDYGTGLKESFKGRAERLGVEIVSETAYNRENPDFRSQLASIQGSNPEALVVAGLYNEAATIAKQARESGINVPVLGGDGVFSDGYNTLAGPAAEGTMVTCPFLFDPSDDRASKFKSDFEALHGRAPDGWAAQGYDAVMLVVDVMRKKGTTREAIHSGIKAINSSATAYDGITGKTYFDAEGDTRKPVLIATVKDGKWVKAEKQLTAEDSDLAAQ
jgi:branched-chain amino acid transport system substrate-binding protein